MIYLLRKENKEKKNSLFLVMVIRNNHLLMNKRKKLYVYYLCKRKKTYRWTIKFWFIKFFFYLCDLSLFLKKKIKINAYMTTLQIIIFSNVYVFSSLYIYIWNKNEISIDLTKWRSNYLFNYKRAFDKKMQLNKFDTDNR